MPERILAGIGGVLLCYANGVTDALGVGILVITVVMHIVRVRARAAVVA
jgi:hypothetical protein